jgi:hypothetical protein
MDFKTVFFSMIATLVLLLIIGTHLKKKEKSISKFEVDYYSALKHYRQSPTDDRKKLALEQCKVYCAAKGLDEQQIENLIAKDFKIQERETVI